MRRRTIEVIKYRRVSFSGEYTNEAIVKRLAHAVLEGLQREMEPDESLAFPVSSSPALLPILNRKRPGTWLIDRLFKPIARLRNNMTDRRRSEADAAASDVTKDQKGHSYE